MNFCSWKHPPVYKARRNGDKEESGCLKVEESRPELSKTRETRNEEEIQDKRVQGWKRISLNPYINASWLTHKLYIKQGYIQKYPCKATPTVFKVRAEI